HRDKVTCLTHINGHVFEDDIPYRDFCSGTQLLSAPYIKSSRNKHKHLILDEADILPFCSRGPIKQNSGNSTRENGQSNAAAHGGFGEVEVVEIHKDHFNFGDLGVSFAHVPPSLHNSE